MHKLLIDHNQKIWQFSPCNMKKLLPKSSKMISYQNNTLDIIFDNFDATSMQDVIMWIMIRNFLC